MVDQPECRLPGVVEFGLPGGTGPHRVPVIDDHHRRTIGLGFELPDEQLVQPRCRLPVDPVHRVAGDVRSHLRGFEAGPDTTPLVFAVGDGQTVAPGTDLEVVGDPGVDGDRWLWAPRERLGEESILTGEAECRRLECEFPSDGGSRGECRGCFSVTR